MTRQQRAFGIRDDRIIITEYARKSSFFSFQFSDKVLADLFLDRSALIAGLFQFSQCLDLCAIHFLVLVYCFAFAALEIPEDEAAETIEGCKKGFSIVGLRELIDESLQIRITGDHEGGDRYFKFFTLCCQVETTAGDLAIEAEAVLVVPFPYFQTGGFPVRDHKYLFIGIASAPENVHRQLETRHRIGVIRADLQIGEVFDLYRPCIVAEYYDVQGVFRICGSDELT